MDRLLKALAEAGLSVNNDMSEEQLRKVAKSVGVEPMDYLERKVSIVSHTNKRDETNEFVKTLPFIVGRKKNGMAQTVQGVFLRTEALDQLIADLQIARGLLDERTDEE